MLRSKSVWRKYSIEFDFYKLQKLHYYFSPYWIIYLSCIFLNVCAIPICIHKSKPHNKNNAKHYCLYATCYFALNLCLIERVFYFYLYCNTKATSSWFGFFFNGVIAPRETLHHNTPTDPLGPFYFFLWSIFLKYICYLNLNSSYYDIFILISNVCLIKKVL